MNGLRVIFYQKCKQRLKFLHLLITTKVWHDDHGYNKTLTPREIKGFYVETWEALIELKNRGLAKSIGVSNFSKENLENIINATQMKPVVNQIELHPGFNRPELREFHQQLNIKTEAWAPLYLENSSLASIARIHNKSVAQVILRWHLQLGNIVIPKTQNKARMQENFSVFDFTLSEKEMNVINEFDDPINGKILFSENILREFS